MNSCTIIYIYIYVCICKKCFCIAVINDSKEIAVYAVTNLLENETDSQVRCVVEAGAIPCICDKLNASDPDLAMVLLEGVLSVLEVRLRVTRSCAYLKSSSFILAPSSQIGAQDASRECSQTNLYAAAVKECGGLEGLRQLEKSGNTVIAGMASSSDQVLLYWSRKGGAETVGAAGCCTLGQLLS